jgi:2-hydroxychromene-2-carboxylate isomerase
MRPLRFHFDYVSPYAYVGWHAMKEIAARHGCVVEAVPVLFAGLLDAYGHKGPAEIPPKRVYIFKDAYRKAHRQRLPPLVPPPSHPFNPLVALRVSSLDMGLEERSRLIDALYAATWAGGGGVESPDAVARIADSIGLAGADIVARASEPAAKARLREQTDAAISSGVFGVPTVLVSSAEGGERNATQSSELFWGVDGLDALDLYLGGRDPVPPDLAARWADLPASATRRQK